ncbi:MAG: divergent PAP2 family protein [Candidatus Saccharimonadaceae bacterium]
MIAYILVPGLAWFMAELAKRLIFANYNKQRKVLGQPIPNRLVLPSGGMPSAHTASLAALVASVGLNEGIDGALFGISLWFAAVVVYDAVMVRKSSGDQGDALNELIVEQKSKVKKPRIAHGHSIAEVAVGGALGSIIALVVFFATK